MRRCIVDIDCSQYLADRWREWLESQVGAQYDQQAIVGFILGLKTHTVGRWICSALQTGALRTIGKLYRVPVPDSQVTPDSLFLLSTAGIGGVIR